MRTRSPLARPTAAALATMAALAVLAGCSDDPEHEAGPEQADTTRQEVTSSSSPGSPGSSPPTSSSSPSSSPTPLPPVAPITPSEAPPTSSAPPAGPLIEAATWADSDYGVTLKIAPTDAGRAASGPDDPHTAWQEVLELAPDAGSPGMWEQFECHWIWARIIEPGKPTWNVEPWRPVVDEGQMIAEGCNPGGPEV